MSASAFIDIVHMEHKNVNIKKIDSSFNFTLHDYFEKVKPQLFIIVATLEDFKDDYEEKYYAMCSGFETTIKL